MINLKRKNIKLESTFLENVWLNSLLLWAEALCIKKEKRKKKEATFERNLSTLSVTG